MITSQHVGQQDTRRLLSASTADADRRQRRTEKRGLAQDSPGGDDSPGAADAKRARLQEEAEAGDPGAVEWMRLENFMCHERFEIEFGPHVNVITGPNGSGKSAIIAALQVAFGASGRATHRGTRLSSLIRTGADCARVEVRLRNRGPDAYAPEVYGSSIGIERTLRRSSGGGGSYFLYSDSGVRLGPATRGGRPAHGEIRRILARFNIQVDNPAVVMLQDVSRTFLSDTDGRAQYDFIMRATQLEQMARKIAETRSNASDMQATLASKELVMRGDGEELARRRREYNRALGMRELEQRVDELGVELAWSYVAESKAARDACAEQLARQEEALRAAQGEAEAARAEERSAGEERASADAELERRSARHQELIADQERITGELDALERELRARRDEAAAEARLADRCERAAERTAAQIEQLRRRVDDGAWAAEVVRRTSQIAELRELISRTRSLQAESRGAKEAARADKLATLDAVSEAERRLERHRRQLESERGRLGDTSQLLARARLAASNNDRLELYADSYRRAHGMIVQRLDEFSRPPIGPLGCAVALTDDRWTLAAEHGLAHLMRTYIVHSDADFRTLRDIMRHAGVWSPQVVISEFVAERYRIAGGGGGGGGGGDGATTKTTLYDVLKLDEAYLANERLYPPAVRSRLDEDTLRSTVLNVLVDQASVEQLVLVDSRADGYNLVKSRQAARAQGKPVGNLTCLDRDGTKILGRGRSIVTIALGGGARRYLTAAAAAGGYASDIARLEGAVRQCRARVGAAEAAEGEAREELERLRRRADEHATSERAHAQAESGHATAAGDAEKELDMLCEMQREHDGDAGARIAEMEGEIARHDAAAAKHRERRQEVGREIEAGEAREADLRGELATVQARIEEEGRRVAAAGDRVHALIGRHRAAIQRREDADASVAACTARVGEARDRLAEADAEHAALVHATAVEEQLERVAIPEGRTSGDIAGDLDEARALLEAQQRDAHGGRTLEQIAREFERFNLSVQRKGEAIQISRNVADEMRRVVEKRARRLLTLRAFYGSAISGGFAEHLQQLRRTGYLDLDHERREVRMRVNVDTDAANRAAAAAGGGDDDDDGGGSHKQSAGRRRGRAAVGGAGAVGSLSGGERTTTTVALLLALWRVVETPLRVLDEIDVFMDAASREQAMQMLLAAALGRFRRQQLIIITPQDVAFAQGRDGVRVLGLRPPPRSE